MYLREAWKPLHGFWAVHLAATGMVLVLAAAAVASACCLLRRRAR
ncbi:hypothetical protein OHB00_24040 [Streptomyces sp. NBC_00631]